MKTGFKCQVLGVRKRVLGAWCWVLGLWLVTCHLSLVTSAFAATHVTGTYDLGANPHVMATVNGTPEYGLIFVQRNKPVTYNGVQYGTQVIPGYLDSSGQLNDGAGNLWLDLIPNLAATPGDGFYVVTVNIQGQVHAELWVVPDVASVDASLVRQSQPPSATPPALFYQFMQQNGAELAQRQKLNFAGAGVNCADNAGELRTDCTFSGGGSGSAPIASATVSGTVKTDVTVADPVVYLKSSADSLLAGKAALTHTHAESDVTNLVSDLAAKVPTTRSVSTTSPLSGGGTLSSDLTLSCPTCSVAGHTHAESDVTNLVSDLGSKADKASISGATQTKITYNNQGIVTGGAQAQFSDLGGSIGAGQLIAPTESALGGIKGRGAGSGTACSGTDKVTGFDASGAITCGTDQTGEAGGGITSLDGLTAATQLFAVPGTSGTAPNWTTSGGDTHVLNIPLASASGVSAGLISKAQYDTFSGKQDALGFTPLNPANNLSDVADATTARGNLGAAASSHTHAESDVTNLVSDLAAKLAASEKGAANGVASLNASTKVVQNPASAQTTPAADKIVLADGSGKVADGWLSSNVSLLGQTIGGAELANPAVGTKGGVEAKTCSGTDKLSAISTDGIPVCSADEGGAGSGDNITINSNAATDANFNDTTPAAPEGVNVKWQKDTSTPNNISAYVPAAGASATGVVSTGAQTLAGMKTFSGDNFILGSSSTYSPMSGLSINKTITGSQFAFGFTIEGTYTATSNSAYGMWMNPTLVAPNSQNVTAFYSGGVVATGSGNTITSAYGGNIVAMTKTGTGSVTTAYGLKVASPTIGGTNIALYAAGSAPSLFDGPIDTGIGFRVSGAATSGQILRGNGTNFVAANDLRSVTYIAGSENVTSVLEDADDQPDFWRNNLGRTYRITEVWCSCDAGTPRIQLTNGGNNVLTDNSGAGLDCTTGGATGTISATYQDAASGNKFGFVMVTAGGTAKRVTLGIQLTAQ
jgi:hypothetical protein